MIGALQPVVLLLMAAMAYEDGKSRQAEALVEAAQIQKEPAGAQQTRRPLKRVASFLFDTGKCDAMMLVYCRNTPCLFLVSPFRPRGSETLAETFQVRVECHPYGQQHDQQPGYDK